jgi:transposase
MWISIKDAVTHFNKTDKTIRSWISDGKLKYKKEPAPHGGHDIIKVFVKEFKRLEAIGNFEKKEAERLEAIGSLKSAGAIGSFEQVSRAENSYPSTPSPRPLCHETEKQILKARAMILLINYDQKTLKRCKNLQELLIKNYKTLTKRKAITVFKDGLTEKNLSYKSLTRWAKRYDKDKKKGLDHKTRSDKGGNRKSIDKELEEMIEFRLWSSGEWNIAAAARDIQKIVDMGVYDEYFEGERVIFKQTITDIIACHGIPPRLISIVNQGQLGGGGEVFGQLEIFFKTMIKPKQRIISGLLYDLNKIHPIFKENTDFDFIPLEFADSSSETSIESLLKRA